MPITKIKEGAVSVVGGWFLRSYIENFLGKAWYRSVTIWGLVAIAAANAGVDAACQLELLHIDNCAWAAGVFDKAGRVLVILGLRRRMQT